MCSGVIPKILAAASPSAGEEIRRTGQEQSCLPPRSSPTGISTMSAVTRALKKANNAFNTLLRENGGRQSSERRGDTDDDSRRRDGRKKKRAGAIITVGVAEKHEGKKPRVIWCCKVTIIFYCSWTWHLSNNCLVDEISKGAHSSLFETKQISCFCPNNSPKHNYFSYRTKRE